MSDHPARFYEFGAFRIDATERLLFRDGQLVPLPLKIFQTLLALVLNSGHVVEKHMLMREIWTDSFVEERSLAQNIFTLRKALGEDRSSPQFIETIPKRGYRFVAIVKEISEESADSNLWPSGNRRRFEVAAAIKSVAVLPFKTLGAETGDEYFGLGMADALITKLSNIKQIILRSTSAVLEYTNPARDPMVIGEELGVDLVLDGKIQRLGERIRVTVQLVSVHNGSPMWADKFDEDLTSIFAVQDSISEQVAQALMLKLTAEEKGQLTKRYTEDTEAYQLYLKGRFYWNKRTPPGLRKSTEYFEQAIEKDPSYALAYSGLADCYNLLSFYSVVPPRESCPKAKAAAAMALEIDSKLVEAITSLAFTNLSYDWNWSEAERGFKDAIELNPSYPTAHQWYAEYLMSMGRSDEAIASIIRAQELDPLSLAIDVNVGFMFNMARQYHLAIESLTKTVELDPHFWPAQWYLARAYGQTGRAEETITVLQKAAALSGENTRVVAELAYAYAVFGKTREAHKILDELNNRSARDYVSPYGVALIYAGGGQKDQAFDWLHKAYQERSNWLIYLKVDPMLDKLRSDPRLADLLRKIGLPP